MKLTSLSAVILAAASLATCVQASGNIKLNGGVVAAGSSIKVDLSPLINSVHYSVSCNIKDANNATNPIVVRVDTACYSSITSTFTLGSQSSDNYVQGLLKAVNTPLVVEPVISSCQAIDPMNQGIIISNTEQSGDIISVDNCIAKPMLNKAN